MDGRRRRKMEEREEYGGADHFKQTVSRGVTWCHVGLGRAVGNLFRRTCAPGHGISLSTAHIALLDADGWSVKSGKVETDG